MFHTLHWEQIQWIPSIYPGAATGWAWPPWRATTTAPSILDPCRCQGPRPPPRRHWDSIRECNGGRGRSTSDRHAERRGRGGGRRSWGRAENGGGTSVTVWWKNQGIELSPLPSSIGSCWAGPIYWTGLSTRPGPFTVFSLMCEICPRYVSYRSRFGQWYETFWTTRWSKIKGWHLVGGTKKELNLEEKPTYCSSSSQKSESNYALKIARKRSEILARYIMLFQ
jgi:hypothetical protein